MLEILLQNSATILLHNATLLLQNPSILLQNASFITKCVGKETMYFSCVPNNIIPAFFVSKIS